MNQILFFANIYRSISIFNDLYTYLFISERG